MKNEILYEVKEFKNLKEMINNSCKEYEKNIAFVIKHKNGKKIEYENITYKTFGEEINSLGTTLLNKGYKDKRIAVIGKNRYEWVLAYTAVINGVGIVIPLDKGLPEDEIKISLKKSKAEIIFCEKHYLEMLNNIMESQETSLKEIICMEEADGVANIRELIIEGKKLIDNGNKEYVNTKINEEKMATIVFTSGTTSLSKAVMLSHKNIISNINSMGKVEKMYETDTNIAFLPFHHTFGSTGMLLFLSKGVKNVFCDGLRHIQENLKEYKVTVFVCVPLLIEAIYKKIEAGIEKKGKTKIIKIAKVICNFLLKFGIDIRRKVFKDVLNELGGEIRFVISGASALDKKVAKGFNDFGILTVQGYGLTETSPVLAAENIKAIRYGSIGYPIPGVEIKIDNPNEEGIGEIIAKGPNVMLGYYEDEEATNEVIKNGWFHTGDLGYTDKDGIIFVAGRKKNVIVLKNGKNIYPEELEVLINALPYVAESMVYGEEKDDDLVVSVKIVYNKEYVNSTYPNMPEEEFRSKVWQDIKEINTKLPKYKYMKKLVLTDEPMIKTTTQKVKRQAELAKMNK